MRLRVACAQINPTLGDIPGNADKIIRYIGLAKKSAADVVLFPEMALSGYPPEDLLMKVHFVEACEKALDNIALHARGIVAVVGSPIMAEDVFNAAAVCSDGAVTAEYRKIFLPNYGVFDERRYFADGEEAMILNLGEHRVGLTICEDIWIEDGPQVDCVLGGGALAVLNISASPFHAEKTRMREQMLSQRASDNGAFIVYCNLVGGQDELVFDGSSCILDQTGKVIARAKSFCEELLVADIDLSAAMKWRLRDGRHREAATNSRFAARPIAFASAPVSGKRDREPITPSVEPIPDAVDLVIAGIEMGIADYVRKNGFSKVVLGLSGGVDSALVAALAADAIGGENVFCIYLPSKFSSDISTTDAKKLARNLGIDLPIVPIEAAMTTYTDMLSGLFKGRREDVTEENIQSRIRGNVIMAVSNKFGHLVLTTGNKSEMSTGYATLYGDMAGGFAPIKDVPKTLVYDICRRINEKAGYDLIPERILTRPPTAELRDNQKDSDTLPEYDLLDRILNLYVEQENSFEQIVEAGFDPAVVGKVIRMVNISEYKRRQAPPGVKITPLAFGKDRRLPITNQFGRVEVPPAVAVAPRDRKKKGPRRG